MKVKIFDCDHELDLEDEINKFIKDKEVIDIKYNIAFQVLGEDQIYLFHLLNLIHDHNRIF